MLFHINYSNSERRATIRNENYRIIEFAIQDSKDSHWELSFNKLPNPDKILRALDNYETVINV